MDTQFLSHNIHRQGLDYFQAQDAHLSKWQQLTYKYTPKLLMQLPIAKPGLYTLTGSSLIGKSTLLKLWVVELLKQNTPANNISFLAGELIHNDAALIELLQKLITNHTNNEHQYILIDDITYVRDWEKAIIFLSHTTLLDFSTIILTSADKTINKKIQPYLSTQQDKNKPNDFHLHPLTFHEMVSLKYPDTKIDDIDLFAEFNHYLLHGGYLIAFNEIAVHGKILDETLIKYATVLLKDMMSLGKQESFLREILTAIIKNYYRPTTWNMLSQELSIDHPKTIGDYIALLESLDAVFIQSALAEDTHKIAPKKARKLMFTDPFIFHAIRAWLSLPQKDAFAKKIQSICSDLELCSQLVKSCVTTHYRRYYPTYYIKAEGEIDIAYLLDGRFWPIVITWTSELRPKDLKQILKYPNSKILTNTLRSGIIDHIRTEPLPQALWRLTDKQLI